jgi:hypothetical protein
VNLPPELQPTDTTEIALPTGIVARLPVCRPTFPRWTGAPPGFDYGGKPLLNYKGEAHFAELVILGMLLEHGWSGVWVGTYGGTHYLRNMPQKWSLRAQLVSSPTDKDAILKRIWKTADTPACFDVFAWRGTDLLFCEAKRQKRDRLTAAQLRFIDGALRCNVSPESFLVVEWTLASTCR